MELTLLCTCVCSTTDNKHYGRCYSPWSLSCTAGGSSGGSASATAGGLCAFAIGSDTLGSCRIPASYSGCVGLKPTHGRVPTSDAMPLSWSLDSVGPLTRTVEDAALVLRTLCGIHADDPCSISSDPEDLALWPCSPNDVESSRAAVRGLRVGLLLECMQDDGSEEELAVRGAVLDALRVLVERGGVQQVDVEESFADLRRHTYAVCHSDASAIHRERYEARADQ